MKKSREIGELIPFNAFYETIEEFMDHDIKQIFARAEKRLENPTAIALSFALNVWKTLVS